MTSLEQACREARDEPVPWNAARAEAAWEGVVPLHRRRKRRRAALRAGLAAMLLLGAGATYPVAGRPQPSEPATVATAARVTPPAPEPEPVVEAAPPQPVAPVEHTSLALLDDEVVAHEAGRKTYRSERSWTGSVQAPGDVEITGEGATFEVESDATHTSITAHTSEVVVRYGGQRVELEPEQTLRVEVTRAVKPKPKPTVQPTPTLQPEAAAEDLLAQADRARKSGDLKSAAEALSRFTQRHPSHADAGTAWFQLGKVERRRGRHAAAAKAFARSRKALRGGVLEMDALAEEAKSLSAAGKKRDAAARARTYLEREPDGLHAGSMAAIAKVK